MKRPEPLTREERTRIDAFIGGRDDKVVMLFGIDVRRMSKEQLIGAIKSLHEQQMLDHKRHMHELQTLGSMRR